MNIYVSTVKLNQHALPVLSAQNAFDQSSFASKPFHNIIVQFCLKSGNRQWELVPPINLEWRQLSMVVLKPSAIPT